MFNNGLLEDIQKALRGAFNFLIYVLFFFKKKNVGGKMTQGKSYLGGVPGGLSGYLVISEESGEKKFKHKTWCGEHEPRNGDICPEHEEVWKELHDEELLKTFAVSSVFYCPVKKCDKFSCGYDLVRANTESDRGELFLDNFGIGEKKNPAMLGLAEELFRVSVRIKILNHKLATKKNRKK